MRAVDEEGVGRELGRCPRLGYYRVCGEELVADQPYDSLEHYLRLLSTCLETRHCINAVPASGRPGVPQRLNLRTLQRMVNVNFLDAGLGIGLPGTLSISLTQPYGNPAFNRGYHMGLFDLASHSSGTTLALRGGPGGNRLYLPRFEDRRDRTPLEKAVKYLPLVYLVSFELVMSYYLLEKASFLLVPPSPKLCSKGFRVQCYLYQGPSTCIYSPRRGSPIKCPLRPLTRRGRRTLGGAFLWLKRAQEKLMEAWKHLPHTPHTRLDLSLACFLVNHLSREALDLAVANALILGESGRPIIDYYAELGLGECRAPSPPNPRLARLLRQLSEPRDQRSMENPHAMRTEVVISLEHLPHTLELMASHVAASRLYKYCRPTPLRRGQKDSLRAYISHRFPLLGEAADGIVEAIARALEHNGCVEPADLEKHMAEDLAREILDYLARRGILSKTASGPYAVYNPTSLLEQLL